MSARKKTILVTDDDRTTRLLVSRMLENDGYKIETSERGEKTLFTALEKHIDAFLIDVRMPGLNGIEICRRLRSIPRYKMSPIICMTSLDDDSNLREVFSAGATDFINKPINPVVLKSRLQAHLQKVEYFNEVERTRRYLNRYLSTKTQRMVEAYSLTGMLPAPERHEVCVMFTDVRGFSSMSQEADLETLFEGLSKFLGMQVSAVYNHGGYIDKFGGDGLMAIFDCENMIENACRCALHINETTQRNQELGDKSAFPLGIGIHYGEVLTGNIGSSEHLDYSVIGETVNLASRLCNNAEPMKIDVSEKIVEALKGTDMHFSEPKYVNVKGYSEKIPIYQLKWAEKKLVGSIPRMDFLYSLNF